MSHYETMYVYITHFQFSPSYHTSSGVCPLKKHHTWVLGDKTSYVM